MTYQYNEILHSCLKNEVDPHMHLLREYIMEILGYKIKYSMT